MAKPLRASTRCVRRPEMIPDLKYSITTPIVHSAPFIFTDTTELKSYMEGESGRIQPEYGRMGNATVERVQNALASIEGGEAACLFSSDMSAILKYMRAIMGPEALGEALRTQATVRLKYPVCRPFLFSVTAMRQSLSMVNTDSLKTRGA